MMTNDPYEKEVKDVKCDLEAKTVTVTYQKDKNNPEMIKRAVENPGFAAKQKKAEDNLPEDNHQLSSMSGIENI